MITTWEIHFTHGRADTGEKRTDVGGKREEEGIHLLRTRKNEKR